MSGELKDYYISFGQVHTHSVNGITFDKDCLALISAESEQKAREKAFEYFGPMWFTSYDATKLTEEEVKRFFPRGIIKVEK